MKHVPGFKKKEAGHIVLVTTSADALWVNQFSDFCLFFPVNNN